MRQRVNRQCPLQLPPLPFGVFQNLHSSTGTTVIQLPPFSVAEMDVDPSKSGAGGGAGPAPFLLKTYDMVDDSATDDIVSWSSSKNSFVVWNPPEFSRLLLPTYFKHNNFSSFIRQLNTYGFRKMDPERWEFANEDFVKDQKHLLKNIHRRKPIHSHSNPRGSSAIDPERTAFEEEINELTHEKTALEKGVSRFKQQQPATKLQLEDLIQRVDSIEQRQHNLLIFLKNVIQNNGFVEQLARKLESMDFSVYYNKKRRLPQDDNPQMVPDDSFVPFRPEFGNAFHHDFANKLRLELSSAVSDINLVSHGPQSSNEDGGNTKMATEEQPELSDSGTSLTFNTDSSFMPKCETASLDCMQPCLNGKEEAEGHVSCQLNLGLASFVSQVNRSQSNLSGENATLSSLRDNQVPLNDAFWEQFLTERPG